MQFYHDWLYNLSYHQEDKIIWISWDLNPVHSTWLSLISSWPRNLIVTLAILFWLKLGLKLVLAYLSDSLQCSLKPLKWSPALA